MGIFKKAAKKGTGYVKEEANSLLNLKTAKFFGADIINSARKVLDPRTVKKGKEESFSNAVQRLNIKESDLRAAYKNYLFKFYLGISLFLLALFFGLKISISSSYFALAPMIGAMAIAISQIFEGSFRCYQINRRELCSVTQWRQNFDNFFPEKFKDDAKLEEEERKSRKRKLSNDIAVRKEK